MKVDLWRKLGEHVVPQVRLALALGSDMDISQLLVKRLFLILRPVAWSDIGHDIAPWVPTYVVNLDFRLSLPTGIGGRLRRGRRLGRRHRFGRGSRLGRRRRLSCGIGHYACLSIVPRNRKRRAARLCFGSGVGGKSDSVGSEAALSSPFARAGLCRQKYVAPHCTYRGPS